MKKWLLCSVFLVSIMTASNAQITWPTYFVNPPSSGCDGLWAINTSATFGACGSTPYTYNFTPIGCNSTPVVFSGDTLFVPLCAVPCNMVLTNSSGQTCSSSTGPATGISEASGSMTNVYPSQLKKGSELTLEFPRTGAQQKIQVFDASGRSVENLVTSETIFRYQVPDAAGIYIIAISSGDGWTELHKIVVE